MKKHVLLFSSSCCHVGTLALLLELFKWKKVVWLFLFVFLNQILKENNSRAQKAETRLQESLRHLSAPAESSVHCVTDRFVSPFFIQLVISVNTDLPQQEVRGTSVSFPLLIAL